MKQIIRHTKKKREFTAGSGDSKMNQIIKHTKRERVYSWFG